MIFERSTESVPIEEWDIEPSDDRTWIRSLALVLIVAALGVWWFHHRRHPAPPAEWIPFSISTPAGTCEPNGQMLYITGPTGTMEQVLVCYGQQPATVTVTR